MSAPRHLWSGDWKLESAAAAEELARRRPPADDEPSTEELEPKAESRPSLGARAIAWLRELRRSLRRRRAPRRAGRRRRFGLAALLAVVLLVIAGAAYGVTSLVGGSSRSRSATIAAGHPWLGIETTSSPLAALGIPTGPGNPFASGAIVTDVIPGGPAAAAGLEPGDVISGIDNRQVTGPNDVEAALAGLHVGDRVTIQYERGLTNYTTQATLAARPAGYP